LRVAGAATATACTSAIVGAPEAAGTALDAGDAAIRLTFVPDEAQAVLAILTQRAGGAQPTDAAWKSLFATEGYRRLAERERSFKRPFDDETFRTFVLTPELLARRDALTATFAAWSGADVRTCGRRALAYLPPGSKLHASVYPEIKPAHNSFVYDLDRDPGIFLYLDPDVSVTTFTYTVAHELHHVGFAQNCPTPQVRMQLAALPDKLQSLHNWIGAFGEGFAVLAGAGGPDVDPGTVVSASAKPEWVNESTTFEPRLRQVETFFRAILNGSLTSDAIPQTGMSFFGNQGPWYTVGWRMAVTIERRFGRPRLIDCIADDRLFLPTYNAAIEGTSLPRWSDDVANAFNRGG